MTTKEILPENAEYTSHGNDPTWQGNVKDSTKLNTCFPVFCLAMPPEEVTADQAFHPNIASQEALMGRLHSTGQK